ncbi:hypothetical protein BLNAU_6736 [Blattamonas nauphoetae]|uniref:Uncharacterized protein n=1 Tax=Blattamonas nauphoetae TaxID=2049346 RepID=A0ABQ9Y3G0_9EUKA|nr:hypothetical protein BLNAU_6736 [Blattamonas nauphoetae]
MMKEQNRTEAGLRRIKDLSYRNNILEGISETSRKQGKDKLGWRDRGQKTVSSTSRVKHIFINRIKQAQHFLLTSFHGVKPPPIIATHPKISVDDYASFLTSNAISSHLVFRICAYVHIDDKTTLYIVEL